MMKLTLITFLFLLIGSLKAQSDSSLIEFKGKFYVDTTDAQHASRMMYLKYAESINCDSCSGSNLEHKICLNLIFQQQDSLLNDRLIRYFQVQEDSLISEITAYHNAWLKHRKFEAMKASDGARGHYLGIAYYGIMIDLTNLRVEELENLIMFYTLDPNTVEQFRLDHANKIEYHEAG